MAGALGCTTVDATIGAGAGRGVARGAGVVGVARGSDAGVLGVPGSRESAEPGVCGVSGVEMGMFKGANVVCGTPTKAG